MGTSVSNWVPDLGFQGCGFSLGLGWVEVVGIGGMAAGMFEKVVGVVG